MRRKDREITDKSLIDAFLAKEQILRIGYYDKGEIYIVPVNYGYICSEHKYSFYFHGARAGRKYELAKAQPQVGFEIDGAYQLVEGTVACEYSARFQSVIGTGTLYLVEDKEEKVRGLNAIMKQTTQKDVWEYEEEMLEAVAVFRLDVERLSCKAK